MSISAAMKPPAIAIPHPKGGTLGRSTVVASLSRQEPRSVLNSVPDRAAEIIVQAHRSEA